MPPRSSDFGFETERLVIRPWRPDDRAAFKALTEDAEVMRHIRAGRPYSDEEVDAWFARQATQLEQHGVCIGALVEKASGRVVGICGVQPLGTTGDFEIGWWLARDVWGRGYATEAGAGAMRYVFETLGRDRVVAIIPPENEASKQVVARLGMHHEGRRTGAELGHAKPEMVFDVYSKAKVSA